MPKAFQLAERKTQRRIRLRGVFPIVISGICRPVMGIRCPFGGEVSCRTKATKDFWSAVQYQQCSIFFSKYSSVIAQYQSRLIRSAPFGIDLQKACGSRRMSDLLRHSALKCLICKRHRAWQTHAVVSIANRGDAFSSCSGALAVLLALSSISRLSWLVII